MTTITQLAYSFFVWTALFLPHISTKAVTPPHPEILHIDNNSENSILRKELESSEWSFLVFADFHGSNQFSFNPLQDNSTDERILTLQSIKKSYGGEVVVLPGDTNSYGSKETQEFIDRIGGTAEEAVYNGGYNCFSSVKKMFGIAGYDKVIVAVGDHEIGGNKGFKFGDTDSKLPTIPYLRKAFTDGYNRNITTGELLFNEPIGNATARPIGTEFNGTSFAHRHKNVLFVTVDAFTQIGNGTKNYIDKELGRGGEGAITCSLTGEHLTWFDHVLSEARKDSTIEHIIVQSHLPIVQPVRKVSCSGQFMDDARLSDFWRVMNQHRVDLYLAGEVHSNTATMSRDGSSLVQIVSRGRAFNNFLKIKVSSNYLEVISYNETGKKKRYNGQYVEQGRLLIDKKIYSRSKVQGSGVLELLDPDAPLIQFNFSDIEPMGTRQILGLTGDDSLIATKVEIRNKNATNSIRNIGAFGSQYDAQVYGVNVVPDVRKVGSNSIFFAPHSRFAIYGVGPFSGGQPISMSIWFKTSERDTDQILCHYGDNYGNHLGAWNYKKSHFTLAIESSGNPVIYTQIDSKIEGQRQGHLANDVWHKIDISMPVQSCMLSEIELYVDGQKIKTKVIGHDANFFALTNGNLSLGGFGYSSNNHELAYPNLQPFTGFIDTFTLYNRPLQLVGDLFTSYESMTCKKTNSTQYRKKLVPGNCSKKCLKKKSCLGFEKKKVDPKHCILFQEEPQPGEPEEGVTCRKKVLD